MGINHEEIVRLHAPERYILGELRAAERDEFEEHLADCPVCLQEVAAADMFAANASAVFADEAVQRAEKESRGWLGFLRPRAAPALAFSGALNLALIGFVGFGLSRLGPPTGPAMVVIPQAVTVRPPARTADSQIVPISGASSFATIQFDLTRSYQTYSYSLEGAGQYSADHASSSETLTLFVRVAGLKPGDHRLQASGSDGQRTFPIGECILRIEPVK